MDGQTAKRLIAAALAARKNAYAPYSHYAVGAAVLADNGMVYSGCNVENASYGATVCAERTAILKAASEGVRKIHALAVIGGPEGCENEMPKEAAPCGICRQVLREFAEPSVCEVIIAKALKIYRIFELSELLPESFGPENLS